jgi:hypothetical protein
MGWRTPALSRCSVFTFLVWPCSAATTSAAVAHLWAGASWLRSYTVEGNCIVAAALRRTEWCVAIDRFITSLHRHTVAVSPLCAQSLAAPAAGVRQRARVRPGRGRGARWPRRQSPTLRRDRGRSATLGDSGVSSSATSSGSASTGSHSCGAGASGGRCERRARPGSCAVSALPPGRR